MRRAPFLSVIMMNIAFVTCSIGILGMCAGASLSEGRPALGENVLLADGGPVALVDNEYLLNPADYGTLERGGSLLLRYLPGKEGFREDSTAFYFENNHGRVVRAAVEQVSGDAGKAQQERLALVSLRLSAEPEGKWSLRRKSKPAELYRKKVAVSHIDEEYTFQSHEDAQVKLVHGVLANALVSGNSHPAPYNSLNVSYPIPPFLMTRRRKIPVLQTGRMLKKRRMRRKEPAAGNGAWKRAGTLRRMPWQSAVRIIFS